MADNRVEIEIRLDGSERASRQLQNVSTATGNMNKKLKSNSKSLQGLERGLGTSIVQLGLYGGAIAGVTLAMSNLIKGGIELNRTIESNTLGIGALISANTLLSDSLGNPTNSFDRFLVSSEKASETLKDIKTAAVDTVATFPELTEVFNNAIGSTLGMSSAYGKTTQEVIDFTIKFSQRMTNIAGAIRMPMYMVREEIRSIAENTITVDSRIAKMLGLTNKAIIKAKKSAGGMVDYLNHKLSDFDVLESEMTFDKLVAKIQDNYDTIRLDSTKPLFDDLYKLLVWYKIYSC